MNFNNNIYILFFFNKKYIELLIEWKLNLRIILFRKNRGFVVFNIDICSISKYFFYFCFCKIKWKGIILFYFDGFYYYLYNN